MSSNIEHHYVTLNGYTAHYASCGDPGQPLLLFVHGFPENWLAWHGMLQSFGEHYHAVALDTRGINESSGPDEVRGYRAGQIVSDLAALLDHLEREKCILIGHDWGGAIACAFAVAHPQRLHGLVMINAVHPGAYRRELAENAAQQAASVYMNFFISEEAEAQVCANDHAYLRAMFAERADAVPSWFDAALQQEYQRAWSRPGSIRAGLAYYRASPLHPASGDDPGAQAVVFDDAALTVRVPTLVIWGEQDRFLLTGCLNGLHRYIPDLHIERIADASHWVIHEQEARVTQLVAHFVKQRLASS
ncbi:alpha/beta fold hydrolase [Paraburkholderia sp. GAS334]|uniref:alpha/beta fold hydrolase n=1 Tax=Paraburkholderia sp. GAS334 TaxID=3035131 RepID=UPI003D19BADF